jgi:hypothetical protein
VNFAHLKYVVNKNATTPGKIKNGEETLQAEKCRIRNVEKCS